MDVNKEREEDPAQDLEEALKGVFADADRAEAVKRLREAAKKTEELSDFWGKIGATALLDWKEDRDHGGQLGPGVILTARGWELHRQAKEIKRIADKMDPKKEAGK